MNDATLIFENTKSLYPERTRPETTTYKLGPCPKCPCGTTAQYGNSFRQCLDCGHIADIYLQISETSVST